MISRILIGVLLGAGLGAVAGHFGRCSSGTCPLTSTPTRGAVYGGILGLSLALAMAAKAPVPDSARDGATVWIDGTEQFEQDVLAAPMPGLVDFYSDRCPPCRKLAPTIGKLAERYQGRAVVGKASLDGGRNAELARRYGVREIPTVLFFQGGELVERFAGLRGEEEYAAVFDRLFEAPRATGEVGGKPRLGEGTTTSQ